MITSSNVGVPSQFSNGFNAGSKFTGRLYKLIYRQLPELLPIVTQKKILTIGATKKDYNGVGKYIIGQEII